MILNQTILYITFFIFRFLHNFYVLYMGKYISYSFIIIINYLVWQYKIEICNISKLLFICGFIVITKIGFLNLLWLFRLFSSIELFRGEIDNNSPNISS